MGRSSEWSKKLALMFSSCDSEHICSPITKKSGFQEPCGIHSPPGSRLSFLHTTPPSLVWPSLDQDDSQTSRHHT